MPINMKASGFSAFLVIAQIVFVNCRLESRSAFSCAIGFNFLSLPDEYVNFAFVKNVEKKVFFYLHTKEKPEGEEITMTENSLKENNFNFSRPTKIITHGYWNKGESDACAIPRDAFLQNKDYNVLVIDWWKMESLLGVPVIYGAACKSVPIVAEYLAKMIDYLVSQGLDLHETTLIGHSLGAHLMGIAASKTKNRINYIVGLDPAGPLFEDKDPSERLSPDDANTVHVIHTNEGDCGMSKSAGHFDFYPNGGNKQPGCRMNSCAHARAYELYAESIHNENGFFANLCSDLNSALKGNCDGDTIKMNENLRIQNKKEGIYHFTTSTTFPFALGKP